MKTEQEIREQMKRFNDDIDSYYKISDFRNVSVVERELKVLKWVLGDEE